MRISDWSSDVCSSDLQPRRARDLADGADEAGDLLVGRSCGEIVPRHIGALGDHEDVGRRLRVDIVERQRVRVFVDPVRRNLAAQDLREDILIVIRRSEEHTSELQSLMRISYAVFCLKTKINNKNTRTKNRHLT